MNLLLGIDAGTTSVKVAIFQPDGRCLAVARHEYQLDTPVADRAQLDPEVYWQAVVDSTRQALKQANVSSDQIVALAVSSQGETTITLDQMGKPIYPALVWVDNRATAQAATLNELLKDKVYAHTGIPEIVPTWSACKILWIKENEPEVFAKAQQFLLVQDYLIYRLTGRFVTDGSISSTTLNYDIVRNTWWHEPLQAIGIKENQLPEIVQPGTIVGQVSSVAASELSLSTHTKVVTGGMDQAVGAIGAGNYKDGIVSETTGAALAIQVTVPNPTMDPNHTIPIYYHSVPGKYLFVPVCPTAGMAFKWYRDQFGLEEMKTAEAQHRDGYDLLTETAEKISPGADGLIMLPHLMGAFSPTPNLLARGSFTGFTLSHTRGHFVRALLEGVAFMLKQNLQLIQKVGLEIREIISTGGGARSRLWNQIKANVCAMPVVILENEDTALLGDVILAAVACGIYPSIEEACQTMVVTKEVIQPNTDTGAYVEPYQMYCELDKQLSDYFKHSFSEKK